MFLHFGRKLSLYCWVDVFQFLKVYGWMVWWNHGDAIIESKHHFHIFSQLYLRNIKKHVVVPFICTWRLNYIGSQQPRAEEQRSLHQILPCQEALKSSNLFGHVNYVLLASSFWDEDQFLQNDSNHLSMIVFSRGFVQADFHSACRPGDFDMREPLRADEKDMHAGCDLMTFRSIWERATYGTMETMAMGQMIIQYYPIPSHVGWLSITSLGPWSQRVVSVEARTTAPHRNVRQQSIVQ